jgi:hypothetical protein
MTMKRPFHRTLAGLFFVLSFLCSISLAAEAPEGKSTPCQIETSLWMLRNLWPDSADFFQLSLGYQLDEKNVLFLNGITWKYKAPLGIPLSDPSFESPDEEYPGYIRAFGLGLGYQRFLWRGLFASLHATPFLQNFYANDDRLMKSGFQLFLQLQFGYQAELFKGRVYLKPALSFNYWPVNTNFPDSFRQKEKNWPNYYCFEPHLNIGFRF